MAQYNPLEIRVLANGKYYSYDDELYHKTFPEEWAMNHLPGTGPKDCENCQAYGHWNGVFIGYCVNCAKHEYLGERGRGFVSFGKEYDGCEEYVSVFETYLKGVDLAEVGDTDFINSVILVMEEEKDQKYFNKLKKYGEMEDIHFCEFHPYGMCGCDASETDEETLSYYVKLQKEQKREEVEVEDLEEDEEEMDDEQRIEWYIDRMSERFENR